MQIELVRGRGLLNAIIVKPFVNGKGENLTAWDVCIEMAKRGMLAKPTHRDIIRLAPPLVITKPQVDECLEILEYSLKACIQ